MTLRKRIRALLADMPGLTSYDFDGTLTVARVSLTMDTTSGPVGKIEDRVNVRGNAGDSLAITISSTFTEDNGIVMMDQTKDMVLIPTEKVERYEDLLHELRYAVSLRGVLEDEFGEERAAEICAAIERDEERRREEERHPEAMAIGKALIAAIENAFYEDQPAGTREEFERRITDSISKSLAWFTRDGEKDNRPD